MTFDFENPFASNGGNILRGGSTKVHVPVASKAMSSVNIVSCQRGSVCACLKEGSMFEDMARVKPRCEGDSGS